MLQKKLLLIVVFIFFNTISSFSFLLNDTLKVSVLDDHKGIVKGVKVFVADNPPFTVNEKGEYLLYLNEVVKFPFEVAIQKEGYELFKFTLVEGSNELEIIVKPSVKKYFHDDLLAKQIAQNNLEKIELDNVSSENKKSWIEDRLIADKKESKNKKDKAEKKTKNSDQESDLLATDQPKKSGKKEEVLISGSEKNEVLPEATLGASQSKLTVKQLDILKDEKEIEEAVIAEMIKADLYKPDTSSNKGNQSIKEKTFNTYKDNFTEISKEIFSERIRLEKTSEKIRAEIERITETLKKEKNLDPVQKKDLEDYLSKLESALKANTLAYEKAQEKTSFMIQNLRAMLVEKDSMYILANQKLKLAEKEKDKVEKRLNRNLVSFTIVIFFLLFLAMVFFAIANRMKKQRKDLMVTKEALSINLHQLNKKNDLVEEQNKHFDNFIYNISKDENGPIKSILRLADKAKKNPQGLDNPFDHIIKNLTRFNSFVIGFLSINKAYKSEVVLSEINLESLIKECDESLKDTLGYDDAKIELAIDKDLYFESDEKLLKSIITNIVENSIKYQDPGRNGLIKISAIDKEDMVQIVVEDNGLGIDPIHQSKIFDLFYQIDINSNGNGLGLSLVKTHIEKLDGKIKVESEPGVGTTFTIKIPANTVREKEEA
jgi:signal transduction histidine kinase